MFGHLFKYRFLKLVRTKEEIIWTFLFPLILATCFKLALGSIVSKTEEFSSIPVAVVTVDQAYADDYRSILDELDSNQTGDASSLLTVSYTNEKAAKKLLANEKVDGIIYVTEDSYLEISKNGINQSVLQSFMDQVSRIRSTLQDIGMNHPEKIAQVASAIQDEVTANRNVPLTDGNPDVMLSYFYALIAMACLYGSFSGLNCAENIQANISALGARRLLAPTHRLKVILADFLATLTVQWASVIALCLYIWFLLGVDLGSQWAYIFLTGLVGSIIGIAFGIFMGSVPVGSFSVKSGLSIGITMLLCFLGGLMSSDITATIQHNVPILNRLNPVALIRDSMYSLNIYSTHDRYFMNLAILLVYAFILCLASYLFTRRTRYASL